MWNVSRFSCMNKLIHEWINLMHLLNGKPTQFSIRDPLIKRIYLVNPFFSLLSAIHKV